MRSQETAKMTIFLPPISVGRARRFLVIRDLAFESSDGYYTAAFWLLCLFMWS